MKQLFKTFWERLKSRPAVIVMIVLLSNCVYLDSVDYEPSVKAGQIATFKMNVRIEPAEAHTGEHLIIGYLVPKSWKADQNTTVTYTTNLAPGVVKTMSLIPEGTLPKNGNGLTWEAALKNRFKVGPNVQDDMQWIAYWSDEVYSVNNGEKLSAVVSIKTKTGPDNMRVKLGFFVNHSDDGLGSDTKHWKVMYTSCFDVVDGEGDVVDFCDLHFNSAQPAGATKDDILTFRFQGDIAQNVLEDAQQIYLCATAFTNKGKTYTVCNLDAKAKMIKENEFGNTYSLTFWPAGYFGIPADESVTSIQYTFLNQDGSIELKQTLDDGSQIPFSYTFNCK